MRPESDLAFAHRLADAADAISIPAFGSSCPTSRKGDGSLVSSVDLAVESALLDVLARERPADSVLSEEYGTVSDGGGARRWVLDPIDGTEPFLAGQRSWGTHIALMVDDEVELALITRPTERRRWWAARGCGAWSGADGPSSDPVRVLVSDVDVLAAARVGGFVAPASGTAATVAAHARWVEHPLGPVIGLLDGEVDAVLAPGGALWDHAPQVLLTVEAGGHYTDRVGGRSPGAGGGLYTNGSLTDQIGTVPALCRLDG